MTYQIVSENIMDSFTCLADAQEQFNDYKNEVPLRRVVLYQTDDHGVSTVIREYPAETITQVDLDLA